MVIAAIAIYIAGALIGYPFVDKNEIAGDIIRARKQQEKIVSPQSVMVAERFQTDTAYRQQVIEALTDMLEYAETRRTALAAPTEEVSTNKEMKEYANSLDSLTRFTNLLSSQLKNTLHDLDNIENDSCAANMNNNLLQTMNLMYVMNAQMEKLQRYNAKAYEKYKGDMDMLGIIIVIIDKTPNNELSTSASAASTRVDLRQ